ncbi:hypothetical protein RRG08_067003 [Elysia crispata]|uniref:Uncharacterized protein n=1 Tax=Elysia crispata TaxID=231223 RepID=A0AAE0Z9U6_9GAST|nr:hypothetical protein RRG08_067003 [Elysia crispata]
MCTHTRTRINRCLDLVYRSAKPAEHFMIATAIIHPTTLFIWFYRDELATVEYQQLAEDRSKTNRWSSIAPKSTATSCGTTHPTSRAARLLTHLTRWNTGGGFVETVSINAINAHRFPNRWRLPEGPRLASRRMQRSRGQGSWAMRSGGLDLRGERVVARVSKIPHLRFRAGVRRLMIAEPILSHGMAEITASCDQNREPVSYQSHGIADITAAARLSPGELDLEGQNEGTRKLKSVTIPSSTTKPITRERSGELVFGIFTRVHDKSTIWRASIRYFHTRSRHSPQLYGSCSPQHWHDTVRLDDIKPTASLHGYLQRRNKIVPILPQYGDEMQGPMWAIYSQYSRPPVVFSIVFNPFNCSNYLQSKGRARLSQKALQNPLSL